MKAYYFLLQRGREDFKHVLLGAVGAQWYVTSFSHIHGRSY